MAQNTWKEKSERLKVEVYALYLAYRDPRVPWYARLLVVAVVAYALSPIDLIPDFIPVLGYLDDLVLLPLGIALALKLIPNPVLAEYREKAQVAVYQDPAASRAVAVVVIILWLLLFAVVLALVARLVTSFS